MAIPGPPLIRARSLAAATSSSTEPASTSRAAAPPISASAMRVCSMSRPWGVTATSSTAVEAAWFTTGTVPPRPTAARIARVTITPICQKPAPTASTNALPTPMPSTMPSTSSMLRRSRRPALEAIVATAAVRDAAERRLRAVSRRGRLARWFAEYGEERG